jgi:hypothetical protein
MIKRIAPCQDRTGGLTLALFDMRDICVNYETYALPTELKEPHIGLGRSSLYIFNSKQTRRPRPDLRSWHINRYQLVPG